MFQKISTWKTLHPDKKLDWYSLYHIFWALWLASLYDNSFRKRSNAFGKIILQKNQYPPSFYEEIIRKIIEKLIEKNRRMTEKWWWWWWWRKRREGRWKIGFYSIPRQTIVQDYFYHTEIEDMLTVVETWRWTFSEK